MERDRSIPPETQAVRLVILPPVFALGILYLVRS